MKSDKYIFNTKFDKIQKVLSTNYQDFSLEFDKSNSKDNIKSSFNTLYKDSTLTNVANYIIYFRKITSKEVMSFLLEQVTELATKLDVTIPTNK